MLKLTTACSKPIFSYLGKTQYTIGVDKSVDLNDIQILDLTVPYVADKLDDHKNTIFNEALTYLGIESAFSDKKERLIEQEVLVNMGSVEAQRLTRLQPRQKACDEINRLFGLNVQVEFNKQVWNIAQKKEGEQNNE